jgi:hypothetical protein
VDATDRDRSAFAAHRRSFPAPSRDRRRAMESDARRWFATGATMVIVLLSTSLICARRRSANNSRRRHNATRGARGAGISRS